MLACVARPPEYPGGMGPLTMSLFAKRLPPQSVAYDVSVVTASLQAKAHLRARVTLAFQ